MRVTRTDLDPAFATVRTTRRRIARGRRRGHGASSPRVRMHLVEAAIARLASGQRPSSEAIADMAIRRATCDLPH
jgi:hypothetical protein